MEEHFVEEHQEDCGPNGCEHATLEESSAETEESAFDYAHEEQVALAFLLALTPLVVLTFFGQVGLL